MIELTQTRVYLAREPVDMRRQIDGLSVLTQEVLAQDPLSSQLFVFCNKSKDKLKCLYWHNNGFCLLYKRLEKGRFQWPAPNDTSVTYSFREFLWLLDGLNLEDLTPVKTLTYSAV